MGETTHVGIIGLGKIGGNTVFTDDEIQQAQLAAREIKFVDVAVSGGTWGIDNGYGLMAGGEASNIAGYVEDSGEGRWTVHEDLNQSMKAVAVLRKQFGGHSVRKS